MTIGNKIRKIRNLRNLTQAELGSKVNLPGDMIRKYENNVRTPKKDRLIQIANALEVDTSALSDINITSIKDILHILFELDEHYKIDLKKDGNTFSLTFNDLEKDAPDLLYFLDAWYDAKSKFNAELEACKNYNTMDAYNKYRIWKSRFPLDLIAKNDKDYLEIKEKYNPLKQQILDKGISVITYTDFALIIEKLLHLGIIIDFFIRLHSVDLAVTTISFQKEQLLSLDNNCELVFSEFLCGLDILCKNGIAVKESVHTFDNITYLDYHIYSSPFSTLLNHIKQNKELIISQNYDVNTFTASLSDGYKLYKHKETLKMFDIPFSDLEK